MRTVVEKLAGDAVAKMFIHREILIFGVYGGNMSTGLPDETFRLGQHRLPIPWPRSSATTAKQPITQRPG